MSCVRIKRWVLRHGTGDVPEHWRAHIAGCAKCRALVDQISVMDSTLEQGDVPDPGEAYWEGFAPSVARRLEALHDTKQQHAVPSASRWSWAKAWAPAVGVAVLALLIGRELTREYAPPTVTDRELTTVATPKVADAPTLSTSEPAPPSETPAMAATENQQQAQKADRPQASRGTTQPANEGPVIRAQPSRQNDEGTADKDAGASQGPLVGDELATMPPPVQATDTDDESSVWPPRRVQIMGQVDRAGDNQPTMDAAGLSDQERSGAADQRFAGIVGESSGTPSPVARIEAPRTFRSADLPDSQSPTEAMRRFDELSELQSQIGTLEKIDPSDRTEQQTLDLCAMWYRVGTLTSSQIDLDQAIEHIDQYSASLKSAERTEWQAKKELLIQRRSTLIR